MKFKNLFLLILAVEILSVLSVASNVHAKSLTKNWGVTYFALSYHSTPAAYLRHISDIDGDGRSDILVAPNSGFPNPMLYALSSQNGNIIWANVYGSVPARITRAEVTDDFTGDGIRDLVLSVDAYSTGTKIVLIDPVNMAQIWQASGDFSSALPVPDVSGDKRKDLAVIGLNSQHMYMLDGMTGNILWTVVNLYDLKDIKTVGADIDGDKVEDIYINMSNGVRVVSGRTGVTIWEYRPNTGYTIPSIAVTQGIKPLFFILETNNTSTSQNIVAFDVTGTVLWNSTFGAAKQLMSAITDINGDGYEDIILVVGSTMVKALGGLTGQILWNQNGLSLGNSAQINYCFVSKTHNKAPAALYAASDQYFNLLDIMTGAILGSEKLVTAGYRIASPDGVDHMKDGAPDSMTFVYKRNCNFAFGGCNNVPPLNPAYIYSFGQ